MLKMLITMNRDKINIEGKYKSDSIYHAIENAFSQMGLPRMSQQGDTLMYRDNGDPRDYGRFGKIVNTFKRQAWFMDYVAEWLLYDSDDSDNPEDFNIEDLLSHYKAKQDLGA